MEQNKDTSTLGSKNLLLSYGPYLPFLVYCKPKLQEFYKNRINKQISSRSDFSGNNSDVISEMPCRNNAPCFNLCDTKTALTNQLEGHQNSIIGI